MYCSRRFPYNFTFRKTDKKTLIYFMANYTSLPGYKFPKHAHTLSTQKVTIHTD